ncbi:MAG: murein L,D-transpeptidase family protein [Chitinophagaceae bacterium]
MKFLPITILLILNMVVTSAQVYKSTYNFIDYQRSFPRINQALQRVEDNLMREFQEKGLTWPAKYLYIRSFKYDSQLEVWIKYEKSEPFQLFKTYRVCALSGKLGPKRMKGDYQVPEGFYYINEFNPNSTYHLSLGLNYPNASDRILADSLIPGGDIYIHGSCVTTGCIPITNDQIEQLYILASHARNLGQDFIPVHIFPVRYDNQKSVQFLNRFLKESPEYVAFNDQLCNAYEYFQQTRRTPLVMVNSSTGSYVLETDRKEIEPVAAVLPPRISGTPHQPNLETSGKTGTAQ